MSTGTVFPVAAGHPDLSGVAIPTIFSMRVQEKFYNEAVIPAITNTNWEGEIANQGDKVVIRGIPNVTVTPWNKGDVLDYESLTPSTTNLLVNKGASFAFKIDDVDAKQFDIDFGAAYQKDAAIQLKLNVEDTVLGDVYDDCSAYNQGATAGKESAGYNLGASTAPLAITKDTIVDKVLECAGVLDETDTPDDGRYFVLPSWACVYLKSALSDASMTGDGKSTVRNGRVGMLDRFTIYQSNRIDTTTDTYTVFNMIFGHKSAITFAGQINSTKKLTLESTHADAVRGLLVYGYKAVNTEQFGWLYGYKA